MRNNFAHQFDRLVDTFPDKVKEMFLTYRNDVYFGYIASGSSNEGPRKYYVYEWFTKDEEKVFYVGKGTGQRYKHIISDMNRTYRGEGYEALREKHGIDYRIVIDGLTDLEAEIYEVCLIYERDKSGEVLLQTKDVPSMRLFSEQVELFKSRNFEPKIEVSDYHRRYFNVKFNGESFDPVEKDALLATHFMFSYSGDSVKTLAEKTEIETYISSLGGRIYTTLAKNAKSIIVFDNLDYIEYKDLKSKGYFAYHSFGVLDFIKSNPTNSQTRTPIYKPFTPKYDKQAHNDMSAIRMEIQSKILTLKSEQTDDGMEIAFEGLEHESQGRQNEAILCYEVAISMGITAPYYYERLAIIYRKCGLFYEENEVLKKAIDNGVVRMQTRYRKSCDIIARLT